MTVPRRPRYTRAADVFTDRAPYSEAYAAALRDHDSRLNAGSAGQELGRRNVLTFYGMGGSGKTQLLRRLERWTAGDEEMRALWGPPPLPNRQPLTSRFELGDKWDVDRVLLGLRAVAAEARLTTAAFDVGLTTRWQTGRAGEAMPDVGRRSGPELQSLVRDGAATALTLAGLPVGAGWLVDRLSERLRAVVGDRQREHTLDRCPSLPEVIDRLEHDRDEASAAEIASLLDWDLAGIPAGERPRWIVFLDTFEKVQEAGRHAEDLIHRLVFGAPQVLWVIAGRQRLDWAEAQVGELARTGERHWPDLATGSAQHLVGDLAPEDVRDFLERVMVARDGAPLLPDDAREAIAGASGLPIYLDLSFQRALQLLEAREPLTPDRFGEPLEALIDRVAAGLPEGERQALNAAALVRSFDPDLIAVGADVRAPIARAFCKRPMVSAADAVGWYQLHDTVRDTVRHAARVAGAWEEEDWQRAGEAMLGLLRDRSKVSEEPDAQLRIGLTAFDIAAELDRRPEWVLKALVEHPSRARAAAAVVGRAKRHEGDWTRSVERLLSCWLGDDAGLHERLLRVVEAGGLTDDIRRRALRHRAYRLRTLGRHDLVAQIFAGLRDEDDTSLLQLQHGMALTHLGRFKEADELKRRLQQAGETSKASRLGGEIDLHHGWIAEAAAATAARAAHFREEHSHYNAMENEVAQARRCALLSPDHLPFVERVIAGARTYAAYSHLRSALCAKALCLAGDAAAVERVLQERAEYAGLVAGSPVDMGELLVRTFDAAVREDREAMRALAPRIDETENLGDDRWRRPMAWWRSWLLDEPLPDFPDVDWIDSVDAVRGRWLDVVRARRAS